MLSEVIIEVFPIIDESLSLSGLEAAEVIHENPGATVGGRAEPSFRSRENFPMRRKFGRKFILRARKW